MTGSIIVGVDGSETAKSTATIAARLAKALDVPPLIVSAYDADDVEVIQVGSEEFRISAQREADRMAAEVANEVAADILLKQRRCTASPQTFSWPRPRPSDSGHPSSLGNRRMQGASRLIGSVANSVSHHAPCDVYIVKTT